MLGNKSNFATSAQIRRVISAAQSAGMVIGSVRIKPDGEICIDAIAIGDAAAVNDFDRLDASGAL